MRLVYQALCDACEEGAAKGRRNSAETVLGFSTKSDHDSAIGQMLRALAQYADDHHVRFERPIGHDYVLGQYWLQMLRGVRGLLNGETGRMYCGDVDHAIMAMFKAADFTGEP